MPDSTSRLRRQPVWLALGLLFIALALSAAAAMAVSVRIGAPARRAARPAAQAPGLQSRSAVMLTSPLLWMQRSST